MGIEDARRALVEARTEVERELADAQARLDRLNTAIGALGPEWTIAFGATAIVRSSNEQFAVVNGIVPPPVVPIGTDDPFANPVTTGEPLPRGTRKDPAAEAKRRERLSAHQQARAAEVTTCGVCGRMLSVAGLGPHMASHRRRGETPIEPPFTAEPITKAPFDPQKARDAAADVAAPREGGGRMAGTGVGYEPPTPKPAPTPPAPVRFGIEDAVAVLDGAA